MNRFAERKDVDHGSGQVWPVILANMNGDHGSLSIQQRLGYNKPMQFRAFLGTRSMFQHTVDRADMLATPQRKVILCSDLYRDEVLAQIGTRISGRLIAQPFERNTASGLFLALTYVMARDHKATVVVYPSDHFVYPEDRFTGAVTAAIEAAGELENRLIVLGYRPSLLESDCEWICPGKEVVLKSERRLQFIRIIVEKSEPLKVRSLMRAGALRNTMIFACKAEALWRLGWRFLPEMMRLLQRFLAAIGTGDEQFELVNIYQQMPSYSFFSDFLAHAARYVAVLELHDVTWSHWRQVEHVTGTMQTLGWSHRISRENQATI